MEWKSSVQNRWLEVARILFWLRAAILFGIMIAAVCSALCVFTWLLSICLVDSSVFRALIGAAAWLGLAVVVWVILRAFGIHGRR